MHVGCGCKLAVVVGARMIGVLREVDVAGAVLSSARRRGVVGVVTEATEESQKGIWDALVKAPASPVVRHRNWLQLKQSS